MSETLSHLMGTIYYFKRERSLKYQNLTNITERVVGALDPNLLYLDLWLLSWVLQSCFVAHNTIVYSIMIHGFA